MGKKGPCFHCGIDSTPLWRNGPPEKPVLCNACGSRYRIGKSLENYTPKYPQGVARKKRKAPFPSDDQVVSTNHTNNTNNKNNASHSSLLEDYPSSESSTSQNQNHFHSRFKQEIINENNRINLASDAVQSGGSFCCFPSRRRTQVVYTRLTPLQKLQRDLNNIASGEGGSSTESVEGPKHDDVLIYDIEVNKLQIPPTEIGLGIVLLKLHTNDDNNNSTYQHQEVIDQPCPSHLDFDIDAQKSSPSVANGSSDDVKAGENEITNVDNDCTSPTMGAADG